MDIKDKNESVEEKLLNLLKTMSDNQYVQCPCRVLAVNGNYVDVLPIVNDELVNQPLYDVKIQRKETSTAYIYFKVHVGDRGILRFFDRSIENYTINGSEGYNEDDRMHDANDGCFEVGFLPDTEAFAYPDDQEIEIALKNVKFRMSIDAEGNIDILSENNVNIKITGDVTSQIDGDVTSTIKGNVESTIDGNLTSTVKGNVTSTIKGNSTTTVIGDASLSANNIKTNGFFTHTGNMYVTGNVNVAGEVTGHYGSQQQSAIPLTAHVHGGVMGGGSDTGTPKL